jgi:hypothetical protein
MESLVALALLGAQAANQYPSMAFENASVDPGSIDQYNRPAKRIQIIKDRSYGRTFKIEADV